MRRLRSLFPIVAMLGVAMSAPAPASAQAETSAPATPTPAAPATDAARVKRALQQPSSGLLEAVQKRQEKLEDVTYRVNVTEKPLNIWDFWGDQPSPVPDYVRSWYFSNWHQEYLRMVTPEYARRATLYPTGMLSLSVLPALEHAVKNALRVRAERRAKEEVQDALEQFFREHPEARRGTPSAPPAPPRP